MTTAEYRQRLSALPERDKQILGLARKAVNAMGFACQMAAQGAERGQIRYENESWAAMTELEALLINTPEEG